MGSHFTQSQRGAQEALLADAVAEEGVGEGAE